MFAFISLTQGYSLSELRKYVLHNRFGTSARLRNLPVRSLCSWAQNYCMNAANLSNQVGHYILKLRLTEYVTPDIEKHVSFGCKNLLFNHLYDSLIVAQIPLSICLLILWQNSTDSTHTVLWTLRDTNLECQSLMPNDIESRHCSTTAIPKHGSQKLIGAQIVGAWFTNKQTKSAILFVR